MHPLTDHRMSPRANVIVIANTSTKPRIHPHLQRKTSWQNRRPDFMRNAD
jgi:hypothetical protein